MPPPMRYCINLALSARTTNRKKMYINEETGRVHQGGRGQVREGIYSFLCVFPVLMTNPPVGGSSNDPVKSRFWQLKMPRTFILE